MQNPANLLHEGLSFSTSASPNVSTTVVVLVAPPPNHRYRFWGASLIVNQNMTGTVRLFIGDGATGPPNNLMILSVHPTGQPGHTAHVPGGLALTVDTPLVVLFTSNVASQACNAVFWYTIEGVTV